MITTTDPRTGATTETSIEATSDAEVAEIVDRATSAFAALARRSREWRAGLLDALAAGLESDRENLVATADSETGLGSVRLNGELTRSAFQLQLFATAIREGAYLEATIDHAGPTPMGPGPDLRRMLLPIGPVGVFGSSNFPFAFSVPGGDTASAIAAGCPVVLKAHGSHPLTSVAAFDALTRAADAYGAPAGLLGIVFGTKAGATLVAHPGIKAVGFTGSLGGGSALLKIIEARPEPIPFYGELSSLNPLIVTEGAASARAESLASGLFGSFTLGAGQFCTKPGVAFIPRGAAGQQVIDGITALVNDATPGVLLNGRISDSFTEIADRLVEDGKATVAASGTASGDGYSVAPRLLLIDAKDMTPEVTEEAFGPLMVVAVYDDDRQIASGLDQIPGSLTATIHSETSEEEHSAELAALVGPKVGRLVFNGYPTGVRVSWAQHHGGPWPSTNSQHTSVGVSAIRRFLRPFAWQDAPQSVLPEELRDDYTAIPRRIDGVLSLGA
ncbi:aldehyde dehydrogenase (NADP(+)) [Naasia lichenicola]|uniref:Aldehyde dehydrogenase (NADP(+)) n=1 Tax=Naasia lichenicola TaxID=2565933 RepID=A0A4S4FRB1_9MICO|nr:aldehyde dehydrogenase (NADP(+)) [Naasia lichenicola]THG33160.1 aldehyde dehydrogenase (NADP(+)) [Naasia lichenicola]